MDDFDEDAFVPLRAFRSSHLDLDAAVALLDAPELPWLGVPTESGHDGGARREFRCDLHVPVRAVGRKIDFHKAALVEIGRAKRANGHVTLEISWRSATLAPLFPVFSGQLTLTADGLALDGWYAPPGGRVGVALDRMMLGVGARRTATWFLGVVAEGLADRERSS